MDLPVLIPTTVVLGGGTFVVYCVGLWGYRLFLAIAAMRTDDPARRETAERLVALTTKHGKP